MSNPRIGVGVFIRKDGKFLIGKRKGAKDHGDGEWHLAGGHLEFGETPEECACREAEEETGVQITNVKFLAMTNDVFGAEKHYVTLFMVGDYKSGEVRTCEPDKCEGWEWVSWEEVPRPLFLPIENLIKQNKSPFDI